MPKAWQIKLTKILSIFLCLLPSIGEKIDDITYGGTSITMLKTGHICHYNARLGINNANGANKKSPPLGKAYEDEIELLLSNGVSESDER